MLLDRGRRAGRHLEWKVRIFTVAAVLAIAGMYLDARWMTGTAIVVLAGGLLLRLIHSDERAEPDEGEAP
jgi:hypothetical protein